MSRQALSLGSRCFVSWFSATGFARGWRTRLGELDRALVLVVMTSLLVNLIGVSWGLPFPEPNWWNEGDRTSNFPWAFDTVAPVGPLAAARDFFSWGQWSRENYIYPLFHYMVLALLYAPFVLYWLLSGQLDPSAGQGYPYGLVDPQSQLAVLTLVARLTSAVMATAVVVLMYLIGKRLHGRRAGLFAALMTSLCYTLVFYAHTSVLEVPCLFWGVAALYFYLKLVDGEQRTRNYVAFGILVALAMSTKDQAYGLFILPIIHIVYVHYRRHFPGMFSLKKLFHACVHKHTLCAAGGFAIAYAIVNNVFFNLPRLRLHFRLLFGGPESWPSADRYLSSESLVGQYQLLRLAAYHTAHSLGWPMAIVCAVGLIYGLCRWPRRTFLISLPAISFYAFFINAGVFYVHSRYTLPLALTLVLFGSNLLAVIFESSGAVRIAGYALAAAVFAYSLASSLSLDLTLINDSRRLATAWVEEHIPPGSTIEVYTSSRSLPYLSRDYQVRTCWSFDERIPVVDADYLIVTERSYRSNSDVTERVAFRRAIQDGGALKELLDGTSGYELQAEFHYRTHDLLSTDIIYPLNPRVFIFRKREA